MNVVGHEAPAKATRVRLAAHLAKHCQIGVAIRVAKENGLLAVAALGDVVRRPRRNDAGSAGQGSLLFEGTVALGTVPKTMYICDLSLSVKRDSP